MRVGRPEVVIPELARAAGAEVVYAHGEVSRDEVRAEERGQKVVEKEGINVKYFWVARCTMWKTFPSALTTYRPTMVASGRP
jgi:deoxyribodipyrimidine photolyase